MKALAYIIVITALLMLFGIVGGHDLKAAAAEHLTYCANVKDKIWPDYNKTFRKECTPDKIKNLENILR